MDLSDDSSFEPRRPLKKRIMEVISMHSSSTSSCDDFSSDDEEIATLKASPADVDSTIETQGSTLSQLTTSPAFTTQLGTQNNRKPKQTFAGYSSSKTRKSATNDDDLLDNHLWAPGLKLTMKAPRDHARAKKESPTTEPEVHAIDDANEGEVSVALRSQSEIMELKRQAFSFSDSKHSSTATIKTGPAKVSLEPKISTKAVLDIKPALLDSTNAPQAAAKAKLSPEPETKKRKTPPSKSSKKQKKLKEQNLSIMTENAIQTPNESSAGVASDLMDLEKTSNQVAQKKMPNNENASNVTLTQKSAPLLKHAGKNSPSATNDNASSKVNRVLASKKAETADVVKAAESKGKVTAKASKGTNTSRATNDVTPKAKSKTQERDKTDMSNAITTVNKLSKPMDASSSLTDTTSSVTLKDGEKSTIKQSSGKTPASGRCKTSAPSKISSKPNETVEPLKRKKMNFQEQVMYHMLWAFKPFTLKTLADEVKTTEAALNYVMLSLLDKGLVLKKDFTSAKGRIKTLYWANHDGKSKEVNLKKHATAEEREAANREMMELRAKEDSLKNILAQVMDGPSNQELTERLDREENLLREVLKRLNEVKARVRESESQPRSSSIMQRPKSGGCPPKSAAVLARERCPRRLKLRINHMRGEWKKRKEKCIDFVDQLADGMEKKPKEVIKILDLDMDEMNGAVMPPKYDVVL